MGLPRVLLALATLMGCGVVSAFAASPDPGVERPRVEVRGTLRRRGIRGPAIGVEVRAERPDGARLGSTFSDGDGRFALSLPPGPLQLVIDDPAYVPSRRALDVPAAGLELPAWGLTPRPSGEAGLRVYGRRPPGSATLDGEALRTTAGTLGDPLRAVQSLPSVGTILTLVPFPIVRGSAPGETAIRIDGTPIPLLFHSGIGQGVVPSVLVDRLTLHTGGAPIEVGQYVSAIEVTTADPDAPGLRGQALLDLVQAGALVSAPIGDEHRITAAGRIGYPGWALSLLDQPVVIDFADYHLRYTWCSGRRRARVSLFGATDRFGDAPADAADQALTEMAFHRLALRWTEPLGPATLEAALDLGLDRFDLPTFGEDDLYFFRSASGAQIDEASIGARLVVDVPLSDWLSLSAGIEQRWRRTENESEVSAGERLLVDGVQARLRLGAWVGATLTAGPLRLSPGVRLDVYDDPLRWAVDPRIDARVGLGRDTAIVGRLGRTQGPQRYPYPIPGVGEYAGETRLHDTLHGQVGVEQVLAHGFDLRWTVFGQRTDGVKASALDPVPIDPWAGFGNSGSTVYSDGRAWGSELFLRRREGGWIDGWLSYTVQRVERRLDDPRVGPSPFPGALVGAPPESGPGPWTRSLLEQQHLLNGVLTLRLPAGWTLGARVHYTSGRPRSQTTDARLDGYVQLDARVEYAWIGAVYTGSAWLDVINVTHAAEPTRPSATEPADAVAYTLPMLGVRARF